MDPRTFRQEYDASFENYQGVVYYTLNREECRTTERIKPGEPLLIYGFFTSFNIDITYPDYHLCSLDIEGLI